MKIIVKDWIIKKNLSTNAAFAVLEEGGIGTVDKETEKAYFVSFFTDYGKVKMWAPKSQCETVEEEPEEDIETLIEKNYSEKKINDKQHKRLKLMIENESNDGFIKEILDEYISENLA